MCFSIFLWSKDDNFCLDFFFQEKKFEKNFWQKHPDMTFSRLLYWTLHSTDKHLCIDHQITRKSRMVTSEKIREKEIHVILNNLVNCKSSSQIYSDNLFKTSTLTLNEIYALPCIASVISCFCCFQYKVTDKAPMKYLPVKGNQKAFMFTLKLIGWIIIKDSKFFFLVSFSVV